MLRPVFADADHEQEDEADTDTDYDADDDGKQQAFTRHQRHRRHRQYPAENHFHSSFGRLFISRVISLRSSVIARPRARGGANPPARWLLMTPASAAEARARGNTPGHPLCA